MFKFANVMAEFCSKCSPYENAFDYDLQKIAIELKRGYSQSFLCEGCNIRGIYKDENGNLFLGRSVDGEIVEEAVNLDELG